MTPDEEFSDADVEDRIVGEFMRQLQESDVDFEIVEEMEGLLDEEDFGGEERIIERVEESVLNDED
ncbi:hypothetical protein [Natronomonas salsuginis]|uniref:Uncharacterized protein n=1 Tax=Natronomonas salsuginis TaxID=2217661 RepID=A0A4U5JF42_9EURY|nr:hypothetical protein [Natronomonas salsuginis]TKR27982.1 hypothetical protein DM868_02565 [Natronomonas salsuginis]